MTKPEDKFTKWVDWADFIIVGAGAAGSIVAARLSEKLPDKNILILELGPDNQSNRYIESASGSALLWNNKMGPQPSPTCLDFHTTMQDSRTYQYPRGNGAGGSTAHHSMVDGRGSYKIYDRIAKLVGDPVWSAENVWKYFKKMEAYNVPFADTRFHGQNGWLRIKHPLMGSSLQRDVIYATNQVTGAPIRYDFGDPHNVAGVGWVDMQVNEQGKRSYSFGDLLAPMLQTNNNIHVLFNVLVTRVILTNDSESTYRTVGVEALDATLTPYSVDCTREDKYNPDKIGKPIQFNARQEVILSGGAINTPQILMLSGIGPRDHLTKHSVPVLVDSPRVGSQILDHHEAAVTYEVDSSVHVWPMQAAQLIQSIDSSSDSDKKKFARLREQLIKFADNREINDSETQVMFDWYSGMDAEGILNPIINNDDPDLHIASDNGFFFDFDLNSKDPLPDGRLRSEYSESQTDKFNLRVFHHFLIEVLKINKFDGTVRLKDRDPRSAPLIDLGLYRDDIACERMARGILMMRKIVMHPALRGYYKKDSKGRPVEIFPGYDVETIDDLKKYLKRWSSFGHHVSGTVPICRSIKTKTDISTGCLDSKLRVLGTSNLRCIDTSVYPAPELHGYNTSRAAYLVGEIGADLILETMTG